MQTMTATELKTALDSGEDLLLLDVRQPEEWELARIEGATLIPMSDIPARLEELPRDRPIVLHCHHGMRSYNVGQYLLTQGFSQVINLEGGIDAWSSQVDPAVPRY